MKVNFHIVEQARKKLGLSQKQFCLKLGVADSTYSKLKQGTRKPTVKLVEQIYFNTGLTLSQIFIFKKKAFTD